MAEPSSGRNTDVFLAYLYDEWLDALHPHSFFGHNKKHTSLTMQGVSMLVCVVVSVNA